VCQSPADDLTHNNISQRKDNLTVKTIVAIVVIDFMSDVTTYLKLKVTKKKWRVLSNPLFVKQPYRTFAWKDISLT
jgi:hypothetical protein